MHDYAVMHNSGVSLHNLCKSFEFAYICTVCLEIKTPVLCMFAGITSRKSDQFQ